LEISKYNAIGIIFQNNFKEAVIMDYQHMSFDDIVKWCQENNEIKWLKETVNSKVKVKDEDGKATDEERDISYIEVKRAFCEKFRKDLLPEKKAKKPSMKDIIANL
jgi:hypothetical protein